MSSPYFTAGGFRKGFDGYSLFAADTSGAGPVYAFPAESVSFSPATGNAYPVLIDNSAVKHNIAAGIVQAKFQQSGPVSVDRGIDTFLTAAFGPRTGGQLAPWIATMAPYAGAAAITAAGLWWNDFTLTGEFALRGDASPVKYELSGLCLDPANIAAATALIAPEVAGTTGAGLSVFGQCGLSNGATSSPTVYDAIKSFKLTIKNDVAIQPTLKDVAHRIAAGCTPAPLSGQLEVVQLRGAVNTVPTADGAYPLTIAIPSGDATHTLTINLALSYDENDQQQPADDFTNIKATYTLFGTSTVNGATFPFVTAYS